MFTIREKNFGNWRCRLHVCFEYILVVYSRLFHYFNHILCDESSAYFIIAHVYLVKSFQPITRSSCGLKDQVQCKVETDLLLHIHKLYTYNEVPNKSVHIYQQYDTLKGVFDAETAI